MKKLSLLSFFMLLALCQSFAQNTTVDCNDAQAIKSYLEKNGFIGVPATIVGMADAVDAEMIYDHAQLIVLMGGEEINIAEGLQKDVKAGASEGFNSAALITKNENFCDATIKSIIYNDFDKAKYDSSINVHIWDNPDSEEDLVFTRINPIDIAKLNDRK